MVTISEMEAMLDDLASALPQELYIKLNGGILLLPETKLHRDNVAKDLYVLGEYHRSRNLGRYIVIYYGSFIKMYGHRSTKKLKAKLESTLKHEFTHHLESLAGERDLEIEDEHKIARYLQRRRRIR